MDILQSGFMDSIMELREEDTTPALLDTNWFASTNALKIYESYVAMDSDQNGMLNKAELKRFGEAKATFTDAFIDRFFEENITYEGEIVCVHNVSQHFSSRFSFYFIRISSAS